MEFDFRHFSEADQKKLLKSIVVLVDTREHDGKNEHILEYFDLMKIPWEKRKLNYGDYSFMIPKNEELGIDNDMYFDRKIIVERKANLEEISNNCTDKTKDGISRIKNEFANAPKEKILLIENSSFEMLVNGEYNTDFSSKSFCGSLFSMWHRYGVPVIFLKENEYTGQYIYYYFYYYLRNLIR